MSKSWQWLLAGGIFIAFVALVEYLTGWQTVWQGMSHLQPSLLIGLLLLSLVSYVARALRIMWAMKLPYGDFRQIFDLSATHILANNLLPMRTGEVAFPVLMKQRFGVSVMRSSSQLLLFRLLDLLVLISLSMTVVVFYFDWLWSVTLLVLLGLCFVSLPWLRALALVIAERRDWTNISSSLQQLPLDRRNFLGTIGLTVVIWLSKLAAFLILVLSLTKLDLVTAVLGVVAAELTSVLPVHGIAGTGTYEGAFVFAAQLSQGNFDELLVVAVQLHIFLLVVSGALFIFGRAFYLLQDNGKITS